jgi:hypothetical protein
MGIRAFRNKKVQPILKAMAGIKAKPGLMTEPLQTQARQLQKKEAPAPAPAAPEPKAPTIGGYTPLAGHTTDAVTAYKRKAKTRKPIQVKARVGRQVMPVTLGKGLN